MALQTVDWSRFPLQKDAYSGVESLLENYLYGKHQPKKLKQEEEIRGNQSRIGGINAMLKERYGEPMAKSKLEGSQLNNSAQEMKNAIAKQFGMQGAQADLDLTRAQTSRLGRMGDGGASGGRKNNPFYGLPPLAKLAMQQHEIDQGFLPGSNGTIPLSPEQQEQYSQLNQLEMVKQGSDAKTRDRALFAKNIEKTIDSTNLEDLTRYSGAKGAAQLKYQQGLDAIGLSDESYKKYEEAKTAADLEAKEIRQFFGDSITPFMNEQLKHLTNPTGLGTSPETAMRKMKKVRDTIKKQLGTYQGALKNADEYSSKKTKNELSEPYRTEEYSSTLPHSNEELLRIIQEAGG